MKAIPRVSKKIIAGLLKPRSPGSHKGDHGHALLFTGSKGRMGSAVIAARACMRSGGGLVTVMVPEAERTIMQVAAPEAMLLFAGQDFEMTVFTAIGMGPALGTAEATVTAVKRMIAESSNGLLLDADAITMLSSDKAMFDNLPAGAILTPHPKEFDRLFGEHDDEDTRRVTAIREARERKIVIVLKGHHTLITSGDESFLNTTGNAGLAKGGSGDALTGIITALLAQGYKPFHSALAGVYLHGLAADICAKKQSAESMLITDVIECLGRAFKETAS